MLSNLHHPRYCLNSMLLSGFTFIRNAEKYDFPVRECIESMLPIVDELIVNVGNSEDGTESLIRSIHSPKIKIINSTWDDTKTANGLVLSEQTNIALDACSGRWALYLQADEALHEEDHSRIRAAVEEADRSATPPDGLRFRYLHFYAGYSLIQRPWNWYPAEIRIVRRESGARSYGDAQTFRLEGDRELNAPIIDARVFHYGHARAPETMAKKITYFHRFWHGDSHGIKVNDKSPYAEGIKDLVWFWDTHPSCYRQRAASGLSWSPTPAKLTGGPFKKIVIFTSGKEWDTALKLKSAIEERTPDAEVGIVNGIYQWIKVFLHHSFKRDSSALVDLYAERRGSFEFLIWIMDPVAGFRWRVADAPNGQLSAFRKRFYTAVNWGAHEDSAKGFRVPDEERIPQLLRWLGFDPSDQRPKL